MKLRYYQNEAVQSIYDYFGSGKTGNPVIAMPTGTGKSLVIGDFIRGAMTAFPGQRIMMLTHVKELIEQNHDKLLKLWPTAPSGIYSAGLNRRDTFCPLIFGGIASVNKKAELFKHIDLVIIDECHLVSPKGETMYRAFIDELKEVNPALKVIGLTATPYRLGLGPITEGGLFTDVCYDITTMEAFNRLIDEKFLAPLVAKKMSAEYKLDGVHIQGGEYVQKELQLAVDKEQLTYDAVKEIIAYGADRNHWLIFASGIEHSHHISDMLDSFGIESVVIHSKMLKEERDENIRAFKAGEVRVAINNNVLTTGFDYPEIDLIGILRPTQSTVLWVQMLGRGTRPVYAFGYDLETLEGRTAAMAAGPKQNCLVLDFAGNTRRLGPVNDPVLPKKKGEKGGGEAPVRICEACGTYNHASARFCIECGIEFPRQIKIETTAGTDELIANGHPIIEIFKVDKVVYVEHRKAGKPPSIKLTYYCGLRIFNEWLCLEHGGFASRKGRSMWRERSSIDPPETTVEALASLSTLAVPTHLRIWLKKTNPEIMSYDFTGTAFSNP